MRITLLRHRTCAVLGVLACALVAGTCRLILDVDDDGGWVYVAAGSPDQGVTLNLIGAPLLWTARSIRAPVDHRHLTLVRDQSTGHLIWFHGRNGDWAAEILGSNLERIVVRRDTAMLEGNLAGRYVVPTADPWGTITENGLVVLPVRGLPTIPTDTVIDGLLVLSATDLSFRGFVPGVFANFQMVTSGRPCCVLAFGTRDATVSRLYEVDVESLSVVDSFAVSAGPDAIHIPGTRRVALAGNGIVEVYDLSLHQSVVIRTVISEGGPIAYDATHNQLLVAGNTDVLALDPASLAESWRFRLVPNNVTQELKTLTVTAAGSVLVGGTGPPPTVFSHETHLVTERVPSSGSPASRPYWGLPRLFSW